MTSERWLSKAVAPNAIDARATMWRRFDGDDWDAFDSWAVNALML